MGYAVALWVLCGIATGIIAQSRKRDGWNWFLLGVLLGPLGVGFALLTPPDEAALEEHALRESGVRNCPHRDALITQETQASTSPSLVKQR